MKQTVKSSLGIRSKIGLLALVLALGASQTANSQQTYTFTNAGATGSVGPTQAQVNTAYLSTNLNGSVIVTGGIQSFTIAQAGNYKIEAWELREGRNCIHRVMLVETEHT